MRALRRLCSRIIRTPAIPARDSPRTRWRSPRRPQALQHQGERGNSRLSDVVVLFASEVQRQRVLGEMNKQVADQNHHRRGLAVNFYRVGMRSSSIPTP